MSTLQTLQTLQDRLEILEIREREEIKKEYEIKKQNLLKRYDDNISEQKDIYNKLFEESLDDKFKNKIEALDILNNGIKQIMNTNRTYEYKQAFIDGMVYRTHGKI